MNEKYFLKLNKKSTSLSHRFWYGGYTIMETMVAVSLFLVVVTIGINTLLNANVVHRKSQDLRNGLDNLSFILEDISRNLRTGSQYYCITSTGSLSNENQSCLGIAFKSQNGDQWVYGIDSEGVWKSTNGMGDDANYYQLNTSEITINTSSSGFSISGAQPPPGDNHQPFVTIRLSGSITYHQDIVTPFSLQTSVSQRLLDF